MLTDATKENQDAVLNEDEHSEETPAESSETKPELLTREQAEKLANERHSKLDKRIAELERVSATSTKALAEAETRAKAAEDRLAEAERAADEAEMERVRGDPDALTTFQAKKAIKDAQAQLAKDRAALARERAEHANDLAEIAANRVSKKAAEIASRYEGVDPAELVALTDGSPEKMEKMAARLSTGKSKESPAPEKNNPDSGKTKGGPGKPTAKQLEDMTPEQYAEWASSRYK